MLTEHRTNTKVITYPMFPIYKGLEKKYRGITEGATHYHATYVSPNWAPELDLVGRIGTHIFYRWR